MRRNILPQEPCCPCCRRREEIVRALPSNTVEQLEANVAQVVAWIREQDA